MTSKTHTFIIAEVGVNHNGSVEEALRLVALAAELGADAVKFQTFKAERSLTAVAPKADYQMQATDRDESQLDMVRKLELADDEHARIKRACQDAGIEFMSTPFDLPSIDLLTERLGVDRIKLASGEITNGPLLLHAARKRLPLLLSTGMATLGEIERALAVIAFGLTDDDTEEPSTEAFERAYASDQGQHALRETVTLLHCTTEYPAPDDEVNLRAIATMERAFGLPVGFSDHTVGVAIPTAAVALGATVVEKHFTSDTAQPGPDHAASSDPDQFGELVRSIRRVEAALGRPAKLPTRSELGNRGIVRKSLVATRTVEPGETIGADDVTAKRPGTGLSPMLYWDVVGTAASGTFHPDSPLTR